LHVGLYFYFRQMLPNRWALHNWDHQAACLPKDGQNRTYIPADRTCPFAFPLSETPGRLCDALLGLNLNETGYLHSKPRDPGWPVCSFAFKSIVYSFHIRISPLKLATVHQFPLAATSTYANSPVHSSSTTCESAKRFLQLGPPNLSGPPGSRFVAALELRCSVPCFQTGNGIQSAHPANPETPLLDLLIIRCFLAVKGAKKASKTACFECFSPATGGHLGKFATAIGGRFCLASHASSITPLIAGQNGVFCPPIAVAAFLPRSIFQQPPSGWQSTHRYGR
jgi:hypothetical protein